MRRLDMHSANVVEGNIERIAELFPNCVTESRDDKGRVRLLVDFAALKKELKGEISEGGGRTI